MATPEPPHEGEETATGGMLRTVGLSVFAVLLALTVALVLFSIPAGFYTVFSGRLSATPWTTLGHPYLWVGPKFELLDFITVSAGSWFVFLMAVYTAFIALSALQSRRPVAAVKESFQSGFSSLMSSPFLVFVVGTGFLVFTASIIDTVVSSSGVAIGGPTGDPLELLLGFTAAPLVEEFGFRLLLVGVVAAVLSIGRSWRGVLGALWRPSKALEGLAVGSGASLIIWAATGLSAVTFGSCHVVCGSTWDIGKFPEAAYGGLVLGILYVKYGFHVAVLVHWGVNYFGSIYAFFGQAAYGVSWTSAPEFVWQLVVDLDMLVAFGLASFLLAGYLILRWFSARRNRLTPEEFDKGLQQGGTVGT